MLLVHVRQMRHHGGSRTSGHDARRGMLRVHVPAMPHHEGPGPRSRHVGQGVLRTHVRGMRTPEPDHVPRHKRVRRLQLLDGLGEERGRRRRVRQGRRRNFLDDRRERHTYGMDRLRGRSAAAPRGVVLRRRDRTGMRNRGRRNPLPAWANGRFRPLHAADSHPRGHRRRGVFHLSGPHEPDDDPGLRVRVRDSVREVEQGPSDMEIRRRHRHHALFRQQRRRTLEQLRQGHLRVRHLRHAQGGPADLPMVPARRPERGHLRRRREGRDALGRLQRVLLRHQRIRPPRTERHPGGAVQHDAEHPGSGGRRLQLQRHARQRQAVHEPGASGDGIRLRRIPHHLDGVRFLRDDQRDDLCGNQGPGRRGPQMHRFRCFLRLDEHGGKHGKQTDLLDHDIQRASVERNARPASLHGDVGDLQGRGPVSPIRASLRVPLLRRKAATLDSCSMDSPTS